MNRTLIKDLNSRIGGTELFELKYFEKKAYLAQSPQFYKQMMVLLTALT